MICIVLQYPYYIFAHMLLVVHMALFAQILSVLAIVRHWHFFFLKESVDRLDVMGGNGFLF